MKSDRGDPKGAPSRRDEVKRSVVCTIFGAASLVAACHGRVDAEGSIVDGGAPVEDADVTGISVPEGGAFRIGGRNQCSRAYDREGTLKALAASPNLAIARVKIQEECSSLGGNHIFAKTETVLRGTHADSLHSGGHGCPTWTMTNHKPYVTFEAFALIGYRAQPAEEIKGGAGWCIDNSRDGDIEAMVIYEGSDPAAELGRALIAPR